jgi:sterol desaturase/sphingolipid hydroxylase (fatty acid hydroxylase superfamily)
VTGGAGRLTLRRLDLRSVARVSLAFYLAFVGLLIVVGAVVWAIAAMTGLIHRLEHLIQDIFGFTSFRFEPWRIILWTILVGVAVALIGTLLNVVGAFAYNLVAARRGGVGVTLVDEAGSPARVSWSGPGPARPVI